jgi:hypothetical protein
MQPQYPNYGQGGYGGGGYGYSQQYYQQQAPPPNQKKKLPFHLIQAPVCLNTPDTDIHVANFNPNIAIVNFWLHSKYDIIFSLFMNARETEHPNKKCTQQLKSLPPNSFEKHFKISASESDPKDNFNVYIEAPIDLDKLSEVQEYEEGTVINSQRYQVIVRLVRLNQGTHKFQLPFRAVLLLLDWKQKRGRVLHVRIGQTEDRN